MSHLDNAQLLELTAYLKRSLRRYEPLQEELLDHLACLVEKNMAAGMDFSQAKAQALEYFTKDEVKKTEGKTLYFVHTKPVIMKVFSFLGVALLLGLATLPFNSTDHSEHLKNSVHIEKSLPPLPPAPAFSEIVLEDPPNEAPLAGQHQITSAYGQRVHPVFKKKMLHRGVDFKAPLGTPIVATGDGTIEFADEEKMYGMKVIIQHDGEYKSLYAHMSEIKVKAGQRVTRGTVIGLVGSSGASTAPHLHYEIIKEGKAVNPADYLPKS
ncbi:peptidoglycan DD-metalloendopeptidase family protein [Flavilitoribacter nigricans]|uniref:M23ase beta-sheet core domain-containing protein n=1 Tax=Flavilitoribacter nigricans (strain ATCC 23147 / DSM 23189 / NBRC 102662 / NCIMB 1420 / SS-2) TaxID=1122177 RepID=A0A2D0N807_FLAN2|nr:peptidoglycan DD-metalloendopeptidase family protein [Flavilitoribacter nigricans]PHN04625.1 hypothetical protein CRP01_21725 [Flavilitoribacter nigricans DSM 23189 = NBRC 102662]